MGCEVVLELGVVVEGLGVKIRASEDRELIVRSLGIDTVEVEAALGGTTVIVGLERRIEAPEIGWVAASAGMAGCCAVGGGRGVLDREFE